MNYSARGCMHCEGVCSKECLPKKETLEETAEREASLFYEKGSLDWNKYRQVFIEGVKCQMERSYSEEEVKDIIAETWIRCVGNNGNNFKEARDKILELFKNKLYNIKK